MVVANAPVLEVDYECVSVYSYAQNTVINRTGFKIFKQVEISRVLKIT